MSPATSLISSESKQRQSLQKDWTSAFATLSSLYGFDAQVPPRSKNCDAPTDSQKTMTGGVTNSHFGSLLHRMVSVDPQFRSPKNTKYSWSISKVFVYV
ncbi:hypothetical protein BYT27DRAFT_7092416 [Phlegmacium glaucopus]|nr:hypothetical protein BYT27DRAFT_7097104 [Phlegmacium glaucopus]KAF8810365.1 hypothetical protein BYT27DRAFT_7092416 [Phlegmacium glaucopus]